MRTHLSGVAAAGLLLLGSVSIATAQTVVIAPEQETVIREYVTKQNVASVELPADVKIEVGATLPETVEVHKVDVPDVNYSYVVAGGQTILVEPETRQIVHIMK